MHEVNREQLLEECRTDVPKPKNEHPVRMDFLQVGQRVRNSGPSS